MSALRGPARRPLATLLLLPLLLLRPAGAPPRRAPLLGRAVARRLAPGEAHAYRLRLAAGELLDLVVEPRAIALRVELRDPQGSPVAAAESAVESLDPAALLYVARRAGDYRLAVRAAAPAAAAGGYALRVAAARRATLADARRAAASRLIRNGTRLLAQDDDELVQPAAASFAGALRLARAAGDAPGTVAALAGGGECKGRLGDPRGEAAAYAEALALAQRAGDRAGEADVLDAIGRSLEERPGEPHPALPSLERARELAHALGDRRREASILADEGDCFIRRTAAEKPRAFPYYWRALALHRAAGDPAGEAGVWQSIGLLQGTSSDARPALGSFLAELALLRRLGDRAREAVALNYLGGVYTALGDNQRALESHRRALPLAHAAGGPEVEAFTLRNVGRVYHLLGDLQAAQEYLERAGALPADPASRASNLAELGSIAYAGGDLARAEGLFRRALALWEGEHDRRGMATALSNLGSVARQRGQGDLALSLYARSVAYSREVGDRRGAGYVLHHMAEMDLDAGRVARGRTRFAEIRDLARSIGDRQLAALALHGMGRAERRAGDWEGARRDLAAALDAIETLRGGIGSQDLRATYLGSLRAVYEDYVDVLMRGGGRAGDAARALAASERARARGVLDLLSEARAELRPALDPRLAARQRGLDAALDAAAAREASLLAGPHAEAAAAALRREIAELAAESQAVAVQLRAGDPRFAALTAPAVLAAPEIARLLDPGDLLLEYLLGEERSYLWAVGPAGMTSHVLPPRRTIEEAARRLYELLTARNATVRFETPEERRARVARADAAAAAAGAVLGRILLGPVAGELGARRLLIVADGALHYLPFSALPEPRPGGGGAARPGLFGTQPAALAARPLVAAHEIVCLPSASALAALRREIAGRPPAPRTVAVLADPVFDRGDERLAGAAHRRTAAVAAAAMGSGAAAYAEASKPPAGLRPPGELVRSAVDTGLAAAEGAALRIPRLPFTRLEAERILALVPPGDGLRALGFAARRATATSPELGRYRYVHFATHGLLDARHPELSGVVLSLVDERGRAEDGFLRLHDIFNLRLGAEMVTLSGCRTGLGREVRGEGLVGLARGFLYAGAARVLVSLWDVPEEASAELMARLYEGMLGPRHLRPAAALRAAQLDVAARAGWEAPAYWAAFVLEGEPR